MIKTKAHKPTSVTPDVPQRFEAEGSDDEGKPKGKHQKKMPIDIDIRLVTWDYKSFREWLETKHEVEQVDIDEPEGLDAIA